MKILVLGGTVFLGRAFTDAALARGHEVAHFNRGRTAPDARVETILGDRAEPMPAAAIRAWDAVVDTSGYLPQAVARSTQALQSARRYLFVSSVSVYRDFSRDGIDEQYGVAAAPDPLPDAVTPETYGALKAACEAVVLDAFGERSSIVRPGLIVGPHDPTDRFTYWPVRVARGGQVLAPGRPQRPVQFIDARDLAEWMLRLLETGASGIFNATGPSAPLTMAQLLESCRAVTAADTTFRWLDDATLLAAGVAPWRELPLWIPESDATMRGLMAVSIAKALQQGLAFRPLAATIADTLAWAQRRDPGHEWRAGLAAEREMSLLEANSVI